MINDKNFCDCEGCGKPISYQVFNYSTQYYGKALCLSCQRVHVEKTYPKELAQRITTKLKGLGAQMVGNTSEKSYE